MKQSQIGHYNQVLNISYYREGIIFAISQCTFRLGEWLLCIWQMCTVGDSLSGCCPLAKIVT